VDISLEVRTPSTAVGLAYNTCRNPYQQTYICTEHFHNYSNSSTRRSDQYRSGNPRDNNKDADFVPRSLDRWNLLYRQEKHDTRRATHDTRHWYRRKETVADGSPSGTLDCCHRHMEWLVDIRYLVSEFVVLHGVCCAEGEAERSSTQETLCD